MQRDRRGKIGRKKSGGALDLRGRRSGFTGSCVGFANTEKGERVLQRIFRVAHGSRVLVPVRLGLSASRRNNLFWGAQATCLPFSATLPKRMRRQAADASRLAACAP